MGTKNKPGRFDCYANAEPDEPMFVLLGRDPIAPLLVDLWARLKGELDGYGPDGHGTEKMSEARQCSNAMTQWKTDPLSQARRRIASYALADIIRDSAGKLP